MKVTEVVMLSDTHQRKCEIPDGDILIHAGDLTMMGSYDQIAAQGDWIRQLPHKHKIVIAGNHDWLFERNQKQALDALGSGIHYLENSGIYLEGLHFWGSPVQPTFFNWAFNVDRGAAIRRYWDMIPYNLDVLITHGPPRGKLDQASPILNTEHLGCDDLLATVLGKKPKVHVFGHIHGGYGVDVDTETVFHNVSIVDEAYRPVNRPQIVEFCTEG